jgi:hypothetical protein
MMMMTTGLITECRVVDVAVQAVAMSMTTWRERRTCREGRKEQENAMEQGISMGIRRRLRTGKGTGMGRGREIVQRTVLFNIPHGEMTFLMPLVCGSRTNYRRQTWIQRAN